MWIGCGRGGRTIPDIGVEKRGGGTVDRYKIQLRYKI